MKFTVSTLLTLAIAAPVAVVQAFPLSIAIKSTLNEGLMRVFPGGEAVKLQFYPGQDPQYIGDLHFEGPGMQRFDVIDDRKEGQKTQDQYMNCWVSVVQDLGLRNEEQVVIQFDGNLKFNTHEALGYEDKVHVKCTWTENGKQ